MREGGGGGEGGRGDEGWEEGGGEAEQWGGGAEGRRGEGRLSNEGGAEGMRDGREIISLSDSVMLHCRFYLDKFWHVGEPSTVSF